LCSFYIAFLLSERFIGEWPALVITRRHTERYGDERNWRWLPPKKLEAGKDM
jgi:hypothetical protein